MHALPFLLALLFASQLDDGVDMRRPGLVVENPQYHFEATIAGVTLEHTFEVRNNASRPIEIAVEDQCGRFAVPPTLVLAPGGAGQLPLGLRLFGLGTKPIARDGELCAYETEIEWKHPGEQSTRSTDVYWVGRVIPLIERDAKIESLAVIGRPLDRTIELPLLRETGFVLDEVATTSNRLEVASFEQRDDARWIARLTAPNGANRASEIRDTLRLRGHLRGDSTPRELAVPVRVASTTPVYTSNWSVNMFHEAFDEFEERGEPVVREFDVRAVEPDERFDVTSVHLEGLYGQPFDVTWSALQPRSAYRVRVRATARPAAEPVVHVGHVVVRTNHSETPELRVQVLATIAEPSCRMPGFGASGCD